jgi:uncharacterized membrane protein
MSLANNSFRESRLRSLAKGLTWRILATMTTATIAFFITGEVHSALTIGGIEFFIKFFIYYAHERAWAAVPLGTMRKIKNLIGIRKNKNNSFDPGI